VILRRDTKVKLIAADASPRMKSKVLKALADRVGPTSV
jgi:hypothetical protein